MARSLSHVEDVKKILLSSKYEEYTEEDFQRMISKFSNSELYEVAKTACTHDRGRPLHVILSTLKSNKVKENSTTELLVRVIQQGCRHDGQVLEILMRHKADVKKQVEMEIGGRLMTLSALEAATNQGDVELTTWLQKWRRPESEVESAYSEVREEETRGQEYDCVGCKEKDKTIGKKDETIREQSKRLRELEMSLAKAGTSTQESSDELQFPEKCSQEGNDCPPWSHQNAPQTVSFCPDCMGRNIRRHPHSEVITVCAQQEHGPG